MTFPVAPPSAQIPWTEPGAAGQGFLSLPALQVMQTLWMAIQGSGGAASGFLMPNFVAAFGGVGDGVTNNDVAFTQAEASAYGYIYLPEGNFLTTLPQSALTKHYWGPGKIVITGVATMPGRFTYIATTPDLPSGFGPTLFWAGDTTAVDPEWHVTGPGTRDYFPNSRYFEAGFIPHPIWLEVKSGNSGWLTVAAGALAIGDTTANMVSVDGISVGDLLGLTPNGMDGAITDYIHIDLIVGTVLTFHCTDAVGNPLGAPGLSTAYPNTGPPPAAVAPGKAVAMKSHRTWGGAHYTKVVGTAGGDVYGAIWRMNQNYVPKAGQQHFFETSTVGQAGGDVLFGAGSSGTFATGWESSYTDNGEDVAVMFQVDSGVRNNDTGARSVVWLGSYFNSTGAKPMDAAHVVSGKWRIGLDTVKADLTNFLAPGDNYNAAINTALGHRWIMNSTASLAGRGGSTVWGTFYGNTPGDMFIESGNDGISDNIMLRFNRGAGSDGHIRLRPNAVQCNVPIQATSIESANALVAGAATPQVVFGPGLGVWIIWDGTHLKATINNGVAYTNIV